MLVCRQANEAKDFEKRLFEGFYTFNTGLIIRVRRDIEGIMARRASQMREFERVRAIDRGAKQLGLQFTREHKAVEDALRKLQIAGDRYQPRHFAADD